MYIPNRQSALEALQRFLPHAGENYASRRNFVSAPLVEANVSGLSPWVRTRLLQEWEIIEHVLHQHSASAASKFIDEVCWRTYWKGWLQLRPAVWEQYLAELNQARKVSFMDATYQAVLAGQSGIECVDQWTQELQQTGYLHNHVRMWYASIWIHTLKLPWVLGADLFMQYLLDGDPASNTLSWRWVAGLHTKGKTYLANPDNIQKYTQGRFEVKERLATEAVIPKSFPIQQPRSLPSLGPLPQKKSRVGVLLQEDDVRALNWLVTNQDTAEIHIAGYFSPAVYSVNKIAPMVAQFRQESLQSVLQADHPLFNDVDSVSNWAATKQLDAVLMAEVPTGMWDSKIQDLQSAVEAQGVKLSMQRCPWDAHFYPLAKAGFFRFKQGISAALHSVVSSS